MESSRDPCHLGPLLVLWWDKGGTESRSYEGMSCKGQGLKPETALSTHVTSHVLTASAHGRASNPPRYPCPVAFPGPVSSCRISAFLLAPLVRGSHLCSHFSLAHDFLVLPDWLTDRLPSPAQPSPARPDSVQPFLVGCWGLPPPARPAGPAGE